MTMAQWHGTDAERWRLEEGATRDVLVVSFASKSAAEVGIAMRIGQGLTLLDKEDVGRIEARFALLKVAPVSV